MRFPLTLSTLLIVGTPVSGQCYYDVTVIQGPTPVTIGEGINNLGHIVGYYLFLGGDERAFVWRPENGLVPLQLPAGTYRSFAYDINDAGDIVGSFDVRGDGLGVLGFSYDGTEFIDLGTLPGATYSEALAINTLGDIVGSWGNVVSGPGSQAFLWRDGEMTDLGPQVGMPDSKGTDINDAGQITGWRGEAPWTVATAFVWDAGVVTDLGVIPEGHTGEGLAINEQGHVVGRGFMDESECTVPVWHAFLWEGGSEAEMIDLGTLPGHLRSRATDLNDARQVVGIFDGYIGCSTLGGFIWQNGELTLLDELIAPEADLTISAATGINDAGQIVGWADMQGEVVAVLLTPVEPPVGDLDGDCGVGILDFLTLLALWGPCPEPCPPTCLGDLDNDCSVGINDFLTLLANWQ